MLEDGQVQESPAQIVKNEMINLYRNNLIARAVAFGGGVRTNATTNISNYDKSTKQKSDLFNVFLN